MKSTLEETKAQKSWINRKLVELELDYLEKYNMVGPAGQKQFLTDVIVIASIMLDELEEE